MLRWTSRSSVAFFRLSGFGILLFLAYILTTQRSQPQAPRLRAGLLPTNSEGCIHIRSGKNVVVSVKTGASEATSKIPALMRTSLRCASNILLFSDLEQDIEQYHLHDALETVSSSVVNHNPEFNFYREQKALWRRDGNISAMIGAKNPESPDQLAAWTLDKYKFLHVLQKTWELNPDMDWYILIDADTYIFWENILMWLDTMDPSKKSYFGSEVNISGQRFAHGGSGIVMSKATVYELAVMHRGIAEKWDGMIRERGICCGDLVLGMIFNELGIKLQDVWPMMSGETQWSLPVGGGTLEYRCKPALTMHHLSPGDMKDLAEFEHGNGNSEALAHIELFEKLVLPSIRSRRKGWDNLASDPGEFGKTGGVSVPAASFEDCAQACEADMNCLQFVYHGDICYIGMSVRLGREREPDGDGMWESGWNRTRFKEWMENQRSCEEIKFPVQDLYTEKVMMLSLDNKLVHAAKKARTATKPFPAVLDTLLGLILEAVQFGMVTNKLPYLLGCAKITNKSSIPTQKLGPYAEQIGGILEGLGLKPWRREGYL